MTQGVLLVSDLVAQHVVVELTEFTLLKLLCYRARRGEGDVI